MTGPSTAVNPTASNERGPHHPQMPGNTYTDAAFLTALGECRSIPVRAIAIRMDSLAMLLRAEAIEPDDAADQINDLALTLLEMATAKQRRAAA